MAEEPIRPATDEEIAVIRPLGYMCIGCDPKTPPETHGSACIFAMEPKLLARIEADAATIRDLQARADKYEAESEQKGIDLMAAERIIAEANEDADILALAPEMLRLQVLQLRDLIGMERESSAATIRDLQAWCERYEGLIVGAGCVLSDPKDTEGNRWCRKNHSYPEIHAEARAIRARREAGKQ